MPDENPENAKTGSGYQKRDDMDQTGKPGRDATSQQDDENCGCSGASTPAGSQSGMGAGQRQGGIGDAQDEDAAMPGSGDERNQQRIAGGTRLPGNGADRNKPGERKNTDQPGQRGPGNQQSDQGQQGSRR